MEWTQRKTVLIVSASPSPARIAVKAVSMPPSPSSHSWKKIAWISSRFMGGSSQPWTGSSVASPASPAISVSAGLGVSMAKAIPAAAAAICAAAST